MPKTRLKSRSAANNQKTEYVQHPSDKPGTRQNKMKSDVVTKNTTEKVCNVEKNIQTSRKDASAIQKRRTNRATSEKIEDEVVSKQDGEVLSDESIEQAASTADEVIQLQDVTVDVKKASVKKETTKPTALKDPLQGVMKQSNMKSKIVFTDSSKCSELSLDDKEIDKVKGSALSEDLFKEESSAEVCKGNESSSEDSVRRSSRARKSKTALELLGIKNKRSVTVQELEDAQTSRKIKMFKSGAPHNKTKESELDKTVSAEDYEDSVKLSEDRKVVGKPGRKKSAREGENRSLALSTGTIPEGVVMSTVEDVGTREKGVKPQTVDNSVDSSKVEVKCKQNKVIKSELSNIKTSEGANVAKIGQSGLFRPGKEGGQVLSDDAKSDVRTVGMDITCDTVSITEEDLSKQITTRYSKPVVKVEPVESNSPTTIADAVTKSGRQSRSGRLISSPRKYREYDTGLGKAGRCSDLVEKLSNEKAGHCPSSGTCRKRVHKPGSENQSVKRFKVVTEKNSTVAILNDLDSELVASVSNVKSEATGGTDDVEVIEEITESKGQLMQADVSTDGVITLTECLLDKSGNVIKINGGTADQLYASGEESANLTSGMAQPGYVASTVVVKSDPDEEQTPVEVHCMDVDDKTVIPKDGVNPALPAGEEQYEEMQVLVGAEAEEVTGDISNQVVVVSPDDKTEDVHLSYEALVKLASEAVHQVEDCDSDMIYQVQLGNGKVTHFMFKKPEDKPGEGDGAVCKVHRGRKSQKSFEERDAKLLTSEELENQERLLGKTLKGRSRPVKQMVVKKELQQLVDNLKPSDSIEQHIIIEPACRDKDLTSGSYRVRGRQMKCKYCNQLLHDRHDFYKHIRTHPEVDYRPFSCPLCEYKANIKAAVVRHINIHSEVMPYVCTVCGRGFNFKQKLQTHMKYHKDIRDYQCPKCPLAFHEYKTLKNHIRIIHGPNTEMPSGEEAKGLRHRASALSRLANIKLQQHVKEEKSATQMVLNGDSRPEVITSGDISADSTQNISAPGALQIGEEKNPDGRKTISCETSQDSEEAISLDHQPTSGSGGSDVDNLASDVMFITGERRRARLSKYIGTKKTQIITERYREGLTKFGASHEEIAASCPWRTSNKTRHHGAGPGDGGTSPNHVIAVEYDSSVQVISESLSAAASIEQQPASSNMAAESSGLLEECVVTDDQTITSVDQSEKSLDHSTTERPSADSTNQTDKAPIVYIQPVRNSDRPPPHNVQKTPFVSLRNLTSTFDEVCQVERYKDDNQLLWRYRCRRCDHIAYNKTFMVDHIQIRHSDIKLWQCPKCDYKCRLRSSIFVHLKMHEGNKKYKCDQCGKCYTLYSKLKNHLFTHSTNADYKCEQCDKKFKRRSDLKKHEDRIHNPDRPFRCEVCDKTFKDKVQIKRHMDSHIEGRNLLCQVCKKYYKNRSSLQQHLKSHMCRFYCELCSKSFGSYSGFMAHKVMHTESFTGFHCDLCGKVLHTKGSLNRHLTISHSTARPYPCLQCKSAFKTKKDLRNHAIVHCSTKNFECSVCGFKSKRCESLHVHMRRHQDVKPYRCGICDKEYMQRRSLQLHLPYHLTELQVRCNICNKRCMTRSHLQQHMKREHGGIDVDVGAIDISKKNSATFYMCEECNSVFLTQDSLAVHILVQHMNQPHDLKVQLKSADAAVTSDGDSANKKSESEETEVSSCNLDMNTTDGSNEGNVIDSLFNVVNTVNSKESVAQYVAITDPKSKEKRVVTVMHPVSDSMMSADTAQNVEVEGEVVMNISDTLADISGAINNIKMEPLQGGQSEESIRGMLHDASDAVVAVPMDAVSMAFVMPKDIDYPQVGDPESIVSFMDPGTNEEFSVSMPPQTIVNLLTPAMETEVVSSINNDDLSAAGDTSLVSAEDNVMVSLSDTVNTTNSDNSQGF